MTLPSLHSIRVFESVARLGNIAAAAAELHVSPGAVSQQLRALQTILNVQVFEKRGRRLALTERGLFLQKAVGGALEKISDCIAEISHNDYVTAEPSVLNVYTTSVHGTTWTAARIFRFLAENNEIRLNMFTARHFHEIDWRKADVAIVYGNPPWPGFWWRMLHGVLLTPVCSPQLLRGPNAIREPADIVRHRLLHEDNGNEWRRWLGQARVPFPGDADIYLDNFGMILQAARDGHGVALIDDVISSRDLDEGRLVQPLSLSVPAAENYHCICNEENLSHPVIGKFIDWLIREASSSPLSIKFEQVAESV